MDMYTALSEWLYVMNLLYCASPSVDGRWPAAVAAPGRCSDGRAPARRPVPERTVQIDIHIYIYMGVYVYICIYINRVVIGWSILGICGQREHTKHQKASLSFIDYSDDDVYDAHTQTHSHPHTQTHTQICGGRGVDVVDGGSGVWLVGWLVVLVVLVVGKCIENIYSYCG